MWVDRRQPQGNKSYNALSPRQWGHYPDNAWKVAFKYPPFEPSTSITTALAVYTASTRGLIPTVLVYFQTCMYLTIFYPVVTVPRHVLNTLPPTTPGTSQLKTDLHHITFLTDVTPNKCTKLHQEPTYNSKLPL